MSIAMKMTAEALEIAIVEGAISEADAVKLLKARYAATPKGRKPSWLSMKLLCKLTGHDMSDTSRVALTAHINGLTANAKAKPSTKAKPAPTKAKPVPAKAAAMTDKPSGRAKAKPAAKPAAKPDYRAQVSEIINANAQRTIDQIMALDIFA
jgi:hypothetical protein